MEWKEDHHQSGKMKGETIMKQYDTDMIAAVLNGANLQETVDTLSAAAERQFKQRTANLKDQQKDLGFLAEALHMPEGSAGRRVAEAILEELKTEYPEAVTRAEEKRTERSLTAFELDRIVRG